MVATLCGPEKEILSWKILPLDHFLTPDEKYEVIEQVMVDATNQTGLDVNLAASHEWLFSPLQFISGFGPIKASAWQRACERAGAIFNRKEITMGKLIRKNVFINSVGFLRVRKSGAATASAHIMDLLDDTRIHPESYDLANNLAKNVCSEEAPNESNEMDDEEQETAIEHVREKPHALKVLDIDDYLKNFPDGGMKKETLNDIKMELLHGFRDWRAPFKEPNPEEEFFLLSGETDNTIMDGRVVQVTVRKLQDNKIICSLGSGLIAFIMAEDYSDDGYDVETLKVREGDVLTCKIKNVNKNRYSVYLTCKASDMRKRPYFDKSNHDPYYREEGISSRNEQEKARNKMELAKKLFKPRMIAHPRFQNLTAEEAIEV